MTRRLGFNQSEGEKLGVGTGRLPSHLHSYVTEVIPFLASPNNLHGWFCFSLCLNMHVDNSFEEIISF